MTTGMVIAALLCGGRARAQAPADLAAARQLFADALADEEHGRYADALAKYKRVLAVRDTPNIRYRMGSSLEHLGRIVQAVDAYGAAVKVGTASGTPADAEVARAAQLRLDALAPRVAHVTLRLPTPPPAGAEVAVDGEPTTLKEVPLDPGTHVVTASAPGAQPFRQQLDLTEGARVDVPIPLDVPITDTTPPPPPPPPPASEPAPYRTAGVVTAVAGGVLLASGVVVLALRSSAIGTLEDACPGGKCPESRRSDLQSTHDRAEIEGPIGVALVATGVAAAGAGVVLMVLGGSEKKTALRIVPVATPTAGMLTLGRSF
jgi:hypothetical protein